MTSSPKSCNRLGVDRLPYYAPDVERECRFILFFVSKICKSKKIEISIENWQIVSLIESIIITINWLLIIYWRRSIGRLLSLWSSFDYLRHQNFSFLPTDCCRLRFSPCDFRCRRDSCGEQTNEVWILKEKKKKIWFSEI